MLFEGDCLSLWGAADLGALGGVRRGDWRVLHLVGVSKNRVDLELVRATFNPKLVLHGVTTSRFAFVPHWQPSSSNAFVLAAHSIDRFN